MNLSEAARTGRKFRRKSEPEFWYLLDGKRMIRTAVNGSQEVSIDAEMLIATDWEPEPLRMSLTAAEIFQYSRNLEGLCSKRRLSSMEFAKALCVELGLLEEDQRVETF